MTTTAYSRALVTTLLVTLTVIALPVSAHHSFANFDDTKQVTLKGTVGEFQWTNPHAWLEVQVLSADGKNEKWSVEMLSPNVLGRMGWKRNSLKLGDEVTVVIHPLRTGEKGGNMVSIQDKNGVPIGGPQQ
jgi:Family of unknown function (DUF6152)